MFKRRRETWSETASLLGADLERNGAIRGALDGYSFVASAPKEITLGSSSPTLVCRVELDDIPGGASVVPKKTRLRRWLPLPGRFVFFDDPDWDKSHAVRADDRELAVEYLTPERRRAILKATGYTTRGESWFEPARVLWRLDPAIRGLEVHLLSLPLTPKLMAEAIRATVALAKVLDPGR